MNTILEKIEHLEERERSDVHNHEHRASTLYRHRPVAKTMNEKRLQFPLHKMKHYHRKSDHLHGAMTTRFNHLLRGLGLCRGKPAHILQEPATKEEAGKAEEERMNE